MGKPPSKATALLKAVEAYGVHKREERKLRVVKRLMRLLVRVVLGPDGPRRFDEWDRRFTAMTPEERTREEQAMLREIQNKLGSS